MWRKRRAEGKKEEEREIPFPMIAKPISTDQRLYRQTDEQSDSQSVMQTDKQDGNFF